MSEGTRLRLPWAPRVAWLDRNPQRVIALVKLLGGDSARRVLVEHADLQPGQRVLEVGCGTGTLLMLITRAQPGLELTGLDPDARALARAKRKADAASVPMRLDRGFSDALPYSDASFDRVFSCFMLHHPVEAQSFLPAFAMP